MSTAETVTVVVLWIVQLGTLGLLLLTFRQIDRSYRTANRGGQIALDLGDPLEAIEVVTTRGLELLNLESSNHVGVLALVSSDCRSCQKLMSSLAELRDRRFGVESLYIVDLNVGQDERGTSAPPPSLRHRYWGAAHPPDIKRQFGVTSLPAMVAFYEGRVVGTSVGDSIRDVTELLDMASDSTGAANT